jgi:hypothetical protein
LNRTEGFYHPGDKKMKKKLILHMSVLLMMLELSACATFDGNDSKALESKVLESKVLESKVLESKVLESKALESKALELEGAQAQLDKGLALTYSDTQKKQAFVIFDEIIKKYESSSDAPLQKIVAIALDNKCYLYWRDFDENESDQGKEALACPAEFIKRFGLSSIPEIQQLVISAFSRTDLILEKLEVRNIIFEQIVSSTSINNAFNKSKEKIANFDKIIQTFESSREADFKNEVAKALIRKGSLLANLSNNEYKPNLMSDALDNFDEVSTRYGNSAEVEMQQQLAEALSQKAFWLGEEGRLNESIACYDDIIKRFGSSKNNNLKNSVDEAESKKNSALDRNASIKKEIEGYDKVIRHFGSRTKPGSQLKVAETLCSKADALQRLHQFNEAVSLDDEVIKNFGSSTNPGLQRLVSLSLYWKSFVLRQQGKLDESNGVNDEIIRRYSVSKESDLQEDAAQAFVSKADNLELQGRDDEAIAHYDEVIKRFGNPTKQCGKCFEHPLATAKASKERLLSKKQP